MHIHITPTIIKDDNEKEKSTSCEVLILFFVTNLQVLHVYVGLNTPLNVFIFHKLKMILHCLPS